MKITKLGYYGLLETCGRQYNYPPSPATATTNSWWWGNIIVSPSSSMVGRALHRTIPCKLWCLIWGSSFLLSKLNLSFHMWNILGVIKILLEPENLDRSTPYIPGWGSLALIIPYFWNKTIHAWSSSVETNIRTGIYFLVYAYMGITNISNLVDL